MEKVRDLQSKMSHLQTIDAQDIITTALKTGNADNIVSEKICSVASDAVPDVIEILKVKASCYKPARQSEIDEFVKSAEGIIKDTVYFLCQDDGAKMLIELIREDKGIKCFQSKVNDLGCINVDPYNRKHFQRKLTDKVHYCVRKALNQCSISTEFLDGWYTTIRHNIPSASDSVMISTSLLAAMLLVQYISTFY